MNEEDDFLRRQAVSKAQLRAKESRAHPIDVVLLNIDDSNSLECFVVEDVDLAVRALNKVDCNDLRPFLTHKTDIAVKDYIKAALTLKEVLNKNNAAVDADVRSYLESVSAEELGKTYASVKTKLATERCADVEYWTMMEQEIRKLLCLHDFKHHFSLLLDRRKRQCPTCHVISEADLHKPQSITDKPEIPRDRWTFMLSKWMRNNVDSDPLEASNPPPSDLNLPLPVYSARLLMHVKWTRLNERRHDHLNPPPRLCTGLSVLVDYRNLRAEETPEYKLTAVDTGRLLTIKAPRLYAPLLFRIPDSQWDCSPKHGFRFAFDHGILLLYVRFKRV